MRTGQDRVTGTGTAGQGRRVPWKAEAEVFLTVAFLGAGALGAVQLLPPGCRPKWCS